MKQRKFIFFALFLCLVSAIGSLAITTQLGNVEIVNVTTKTELATLTGYLFIPEDASTDNKKPTIIVSHGSSASAEFVESWYIELARRGYVVFAPNLYGHGDSSLANKSYENTPQYESNGLIDAVEYVYTLGIVDTEKIGIMGHSLGGGSSMITASYYTSLENEAIINGITPEEAKKLNKISAILTVAYPLQVYIEGFESTANFQGYSADLGVILGKYDDFQSWMNKDILTNGYGNDWLYSQTSIEVNELEEGNFYRNTENGYSFVLWNPNEIHNQNLISSNTTSYIIDFFQDSLNAPNPIDSNSQIWMWKKLFGAIGLFGIFSFIVPCISFILNLPFFSSLKGVPTEFTPLAGKEKKKFIMNTVLGAFINTILLLPLILIGGFLLPTILFPQTPTSGFALWGLIGGLITLLTIKLCMGKKFKFISEDLGTALNEKNKWLKSLLLGAIVIFFVYLIVFIVKWMFNTDFRFWSYAIKPFQINKLTQALRYLPLFSVFHIATAITTWRTKWTGWSDNKRILLSTLLCMLPIILMLLITYIPILFVGSPMWGQDGSNLLLLAGADSAIKLLSFVISLAVISIINVKSQKYTGSIWVGASTNTLLITIITVANCSSSYWW